MDRDLARHLIRINFRCSRELQDAMRILKQHLPEAAYNKQARKIAVAIAALGDALTNEALAEHPGLEVEVEKSLAQYGEFI